MNDPRIHISISAASPAEAHSMLEQLLNGKRQPHVGECQSAPVADEKAPAAETPKQTRGKSTPKKDAPKQEKAPEPEAETETESTDDATEAGNEHAGEEYTRSDLKDVIKEIHGKGGDAVLTKVQKILKSTANAAKQSEVADEHVSAVVAELKTLLENL